MWFQFGSEDIAAELRALNRSLSGIAQTLTRIEGKQDATMALVAIEQSDLDAIAVTVVQVAEHLQKVLDSDEDLGPADTRAIQDALTKLQAVGPRVPTDAPPVSEPVDPAETPVPVPNPDTAPPAEAPVTEVDDVAPVDPSAPVVTDPAAGDAVVTDPAAGDAPVADPAASPADFGNTDPDA